MASSFPTSYDSFNNPSASTMENASGYEHSILHSKANDAIYAVQHALGLNPQGSAADVAARLTAIESVQGTAPVFVGTSAPSNPTNGMVWFDTTGA
jgi:hypothetical protein